GNREDVDAVVGDDRAGVGPNRRLVPVALDLGVEAGEAVHLVLELVGEGRLVGIAQPGGRLGGRAELAQRQHPAGDGGGGHLLGGVEAGLLRPGGAGAEADGAGGGDGQGGADDQRRADGGPGHCCTSPSPVAMSESSRLSSVSRRWRIWSTSATSASVTGPVAGGLVGEDAVADEGVVAEAFDPLPELLLQPAVPTLSARRTAIATLFTETSRSADSVS